MVELADRTEGVKTGALGRATGSVRAMTEDGADTVGREITDGFALPTVGATGLGARSAKEGKGLT